MFPYAQTGETALLAALTAAVGGQAVSHDFPGIGGELWIVCDDKSMPADETPHSGGLKIRGGTLAQEMGLGKRQISVIMDKQVSIKCKD